MTPNSVSVGNDNIHISGGDSNKSELYSRRHQERMNSGNAYRYSGRSILSFRVLSKTHYETLNLLIFMGVKLGLSL
jgi:hypothetical protein